MPMLSPNDPVATLATFKAHATAALAGLREAHNLVGGLLSGAQQFNMAVAETYRTAARQIDAATTFAAVQAALVTVTTTFAGLTLT